MSDVGRKKWASTARNLIHRVMDAKGIWHTEFPDLAKEVLNYYDIKRVLKGVETFVTADTND